MRNFFILWKTSLIFGQVHIIIKKSNSLMVRGVLFNYTGGGYHLQDQSVPWPCIPRGDGSSPGAGDFSFQQWIAGL